MKLNRHASAILITILAFAFMTTSVLAGEREQIHFVDIDAKTMTTFVTNRGKGSQSKLLYKIKDYPELSDILDDMIYFFPNSYSYNKDPVNSAYNALIAGSSTTSRLTQRNFNDMRYHRYQANEDGSISLAMDIPGPNGHVGMWTGIDGGYTQLAMAWVFQDNVELVEYSASKPGEWVERGNTIAFFGESVNDVVINIKVQFRSTADQKRISEKIGNQQGVEVKAEESGVRIVLRDKVLFASGSAEVSLSGRDVLNLIDGELRDTKAKVIVAGHTDNVPIVGELAVEYPSNWHLSSARALSVLGYFLEQGAEEHKFELQSFGENRPIATNETDDGRAQNRRIEVLLQY